MGRNSKRNKAITKMYLPRLKKYCEELEKQLEALKTDPNTTLGQVINQARELYTQNSRLSVLTASLLESLGNKVTVSKAAMDKFENHRILIKWELPEGVAKAEDATEFVFMYEAVKNEPQGQPIQVGPMTHASVPITAEAIEGTGPLQVGDPAVIPVNDDEDEAEQQNLYPKQYESTETDDPSEDQGDIISNATQEEIDAQTYAPPGVYTQEIVSNSQQGVDCPYCEDNTEHTHSMEEIEELQGDPLPECDVHTRTKAAE